MPYLHIPAHESSVYFLLFILYQTENQTKPQKADNLYKFYEKKKITE